MKGNKYMNDFKFFTNLNESFVINEGKDLSKEEIEELKKKFEQALNDDWSEIGKSIKQCIKSINGVDDTNKGSHCKIINPTKSASSGGYNKPYGKYVGVVLVYDDPNIGLSKFSKEYKESNLKEVEKAIKTTVKYLNEYSKNNSNKLKFFADPDPVSKKYYITAMLKNAD